MHSCILTKSAKNTVGDKMTIIFFRTLIIYVFVVAAVRIMGKRQIGELKPHELVITILISSVATVPLENNSIPLTYSLIPILMLISLEILQSAICMKSIKFRNMLQGKPVFVVKNGKLQQKALKSLRFTLDDLIDSMRQQNAFDISQVQNAVIETNGMLSVQKKADYTPLTPSTVGIKTQEVTVPITIVIDGKPISEYFAQEIIKESEIKFILKSKDKDISKIMLMTLDDNGETYIVEKEEE